MYDEMLLYSLQKTSFSKGKAMNEKGKIFSILPEACKYYTCIVHIICRKRKKKYNRNLIYIHIILFLFHVTVNMDMSVYVCRYGTIGSSSIYVER